MLWFYLYQFSLRIEAAGLPRQLFCFFAPHSTDRSCGNMFTRILLYQTNTYTMNTAIKITNQTITFLLEIAMLISFGYYGMTRSWHFFPRLLFTIVILAVAIGLWAILAAPKSARRLKMPYQTIFRIAMFLLSASLLFQTGQKGIAIILACLAIITQTISYFTEK